MKNSIFHRIGDHYTSLVEPGRFMGRSALEDRWLVPPEVKISENDGYYCIEVSLPGFSKKEIDVSVVENDLTIYAEKGENAEDRRGKITPRKKIFRLDPDIDQKKITVEYENAILYIKLPLKEGAVSNKAKIINIS